MHQLPRYALVRSPDVERVLKHKRVGGRRGALVHEVVSSHGGGGQPRTDGDDTGAAVGLLGTRGGIQLAGEDSDCKAKIRGVGR